MSDCEQLKRKAIELLREAKPCYSYRYLAKVLKAPCECVVCRILKGQRDITCEEAEFIVMVLEPYARRCKEAREMGVAVNA